MNDKGVPVTITTVTIAMVGAIIMILYSALSAEADTSGMSSDWCYISAAPEDRSVCFPNHKECNKAQSSDLFASSSCYRNPLVGKLD
jgi:hypothetical protein